MSSFFIFISFSNASYALRETSGYTFLKQKMKGDLKMGKTLEGIKFIKDYNTACIDSDQSDFLLTFDKTPEYFMSYESRQRFIQKTKRMIRSSKKYKNFKSLIMSRIDHCQIVPTFSEENGCTLEMHHGPIFELAEIIDVMIDYFLLKGKEITTMTIADAVLDEHYEGRVQVMILSKTSHESITNRQIFVNVNQFFGDIQAFMDKYNDVISNEKKKEYNEYILRSQSFESNDFDVFSTKQLQNQFVYEKEDEDE